MIIHDDAPMCKRRVQVIEQIERDLYADVTRK